jgi:hypothetical protein
MSHNIAVIITILLFVLAGWGLIRALRALEKFARRLIDKAKGISPEQRTALTEEALLEAEKAKLSKVEETKQAREQLMRRRKALERKMGTPIGSIFEGWYLIIWAIFVGLLIFQFSDYLKASERHMDALTKSIEQTHTR